MKHVFITLSILLACNGLDAQDTTLDHSKLKRGDLEGNLRLLNLWGEMPPGVQQLYEAAYSVLASLTLRVGVPEL